MSSLKDIWEETITSVMKWRQEKSKLFIITKLTKIYKGSDFHQPNETTMKKRMGNAFPLVFFPTTFFKLYKLNHWEFPYIIFSFSILQKVFWGMCRSELFDKSLEKEREFIKKKKIYWFSKNWQKFSKKDKRSPYIRLLALFCFLNHSEGRY